MKEAQTILDKKIEIASRLFQEGKITLEEAAQLVGVSQTSAYKLLGSQAQPVPVAAAGIAGVQIKHLVTHADDRGFFREIVRDDDGLLQRFGQTSVTVTNPGVIKAFHWHNRQDDIWYVASGMARVVLHDMREDSPTFRKTHVVYAGEQNPVVIRIPVRVAHGYQVIGRKPVMLLYHTTESYNPADPDEERILFDDPNVGFDWSIKNR